MLKLGLCRDHVYAVMSYVNKLDEFNKLYKPQQTAVIIT